MSNSDIYLVWSNEHRGWWRDGGWGYAKGLEGAGKFTRSAAFEICRHALPTAMHLGMISEIPVRFADIKAFLEGQVIPTSIITEADVTPKEADQE